MSTGLVMVKSNDQIDRETVDSKVAPEAVDVNEQLMTGLCRHIETCWQSAKSAKHEIEQEQIDALLRRAGKYSAQKEAEIREAGQPVIYMNLTANKCRAAEGWLTDIALANGERPFAIEPSPVPEVPPAVKQQIQQMLIGQMQQAVMSGAVVDVTQLPAMAEEMERKAREAVLNDAKRRAALMEDAIDDRASEGDWYNAIEDCIPHLVTHQNCFLKGPIITKKKVLKYTITDGNRDDYVPQVTETLVPTFYAVDPLNIFPSANAKGVQDGYLFERIPMRRGKLYECIGIPGFNEQRLRAALEEYRDGHNVQTNADSHLRIIDRNQSELTSPDMPIDVLEFHGAVPGYMMLEWGVTGADPVASYEIQAWKIGRFIVRAVINEHPIGRRPYESASFDRRAGTFWGWGGVPHAMRDIQDLCNACARSLAANMAFSSGPQVVVNIDRLAEGERVEDMRPWKIWQTKESKHPTNTSKAIDFFVPDPVANVLQGVYEYFSAKADEYTGIPAYATGIPTGKGAAGTASGMSMLMGQATRQMKRVVANLDRAIEGSIGALHLHEMLYNPDPAIKGDAWVRPRGTGALMVREQNQMRLNEALQVTANPIDMGIIGNEGRAEMLRALIKDFDLPVENVVPGREEIIARAKAAMEAQVAQQVQAAGASAPDGSPAGGGMGNTVTKL